MPSTENENINKNLIPYPEAVEELSAARLQLSNIFLNLVNARQVLEHSSLDARAFNLSISCRELIRELDDVLLRIIRSESQS